MDGSTFMGNYTRMIEYRHEKHNTILPVSWSAGLGHDGDRHSVPMRAELDRHERTGCRALLRDEAMRVRRAQRESSPRGVVGSTARPRPGVGWLKDAEKAKGRRKRNHLETLRKGLMGIPTILWQYLYFRNITEPL